MSTSIKSGLKLSIYTDGGARGNPGPAAVGVVVLDEQGQQIHTISSYIGSATNNHAEYMAVLMATKWLLNNPAKPATISWFLDSKLVVEQLMKRWKIKHAPLMPLANEIWRNLSELGITPSFTHIPREQNKVADALVNQALDSAI